MIAMHTAHVVALVCVAFSVGAMGASLVSNARSDYRAGIAYRQGYRAGAAQRDSEEARK